MRRAQSSDVVLCWISFHYVSVDLFVFYFYWFHLKIDTTTNCPTNACDYMYIIVYVCVLYFSSKNHECDDVKHQAFVRSFNSIDSKVHLYYLQAILIYMYSFIYFASQCKMIFNLWVYFYFMQFSVHSLLFWTMFLLCVCVKENRLTAERNENKFTRLSFLFLLKFLVSNT